MKYFRQSSGIFKFLALCLALSLLPGCSGGQSDSGSAAPDPGYAGTGTYGAGPSSHGQLSIDPGGSITGSGGERVLLRGVSTHGIAWFPQYINANAFLSVKNAGGNTVRIAMYTDGSGCYLQDPDANLTLMLQAIENARALDMYVIVDWHILTDGDPNAHKDEAITFFDAIAGRYAGDPAVIYEICNEPNGVSWDGIKQYAYALVPVIRQYSPQALIIIGTPNYCTELGAVIASPFEAENIAYAFHYYAGQHENYNVLKQAVAAKLPVFVSEWGINTVPDGSPALDAGGEFAQYLNENGLSWCAWSLSNKDEVFSMLQSGCQALGGWTGGDLTDVGALIFRALGGAAE